MQAHPRARRVIVDQTGLRRMRIAAEITPRVKDLLRKIRPRRAGFGMRFLVAVAALLVGDPAERTAIRHAHGKRFARARHSWREQWRGPNDIAKASEQMLFRGGI